MRAFFSLIGDVLIAVTGIALYLFALLIFIAMAYAQSPDGSIVLPPNINPIGPLGNVSNGLSTSFGIMTLAPQTSPSGDYFALVNGIFTNGGGRMITTLNGGQLYAETIDGNWFLYGGGTTWTAVSPPVSPDQTVVTAASGLPLISADGVWSFGKDSVIGGHEILLDSLPRNLGANSLEILGGIVFAEDAAGSWSQWGGWIPTANPNSYSVPQTMTAGYLSANFHQTFSDGFALGLPTICLNGTFSATCNWYNGTEQCCMSPTPQPGNVGGAMFPTSVGANGPYNPYSNNQAGGLTMTMHTETTTDATHTFTSVFSGVMTTTSADGQGFKQQYGYLEATMWVSPNNGTWPAFWMLSPSKNMEIDIMEQYGHDPNHYWGTVSDYEIPPSPTNRHPMEFPSAGLNLTTGFHQYGLLWDAGHVSFYLDRQLMWSTATPPAAKQPMYMLLDQGSGSGWQTCAGPSQVGVSPPPPGTSCGTGPAQLEGAQLLVQSVNVWQHN